LNIKFIML